MSDDGDDDGVPELLVGPSVRHDDGELLGEPHQSSTLLRRQSTRALAPALPDEDLRPILVVAGAESARDVLATHQAEAESIPVALVLGLVVPEVSPEVRRQGVLRVDPLFEDGPEL